MSTVDSYPKQFKALQQMMGGLGKALPGPMGGFMQLHKSSSEPGALSAKIKELMALAIAITVRCEGCIAYHVHDALAAGASEAEVLETIGVAIQMGGGPSVVYGSKAKLALDQFLAEA